MNVMPVDENNLNALLQQAVSKVRAVTDKDLVPHAARTPDTLPVRIEVRLELLKIAAAHMPAKFVMNETKLRRWVDYLADSII